MSGYHEPDLGDDSLPDAVTAQEALGDLPFLLGSSVTRGARRFDELAPYRPGANLSPYARLMRHDWPGFAGGEGVGPRHPGAAA